MQESLITGHLFHIEGEFLATIAKDLRVLEVGTHYGRSASYLGLSAKSVVTLDTYQGDSFIAPSNYKQAVENLSSFPNVLAIKSDWKLYLQNISINNFDMIFYDGDHLQEGEFLSHCYNFSGVIAVHDYKPDLPLFNHVVEAVDAFATLTTREKLIGPGSIVWFNSTTNPIPVP